VEEIVSDPARVLHATRRELARLPALLDALVGDLDGATARARPAPGEWSAVEILCHLRDEEAEDFGARLRVILDGQESFSPIDPERWAAERRYQDVPMAEVLDAFKTRRRATLDLLDSVVPAALLGARALGKAGPLSGMDLLVAWVAHDLLHVRQLAGTLARVWAERWAPLRAEYAGPVPYAPEPRD
jgi:hypothetical protein